MPRQKNYDEKEVTEKAMKLFWTNGYTMTSARMLEKGMGINLFSIYSSFQNKDGVFLASIKSYKSLMRTELLEPLSQRVPTVDNLKTFFYDFLKFTNMENQHKGCLLINTANELTENLNADVAQEIIGFSEEIMTVFKKILSSDGTKTSELVDKQASYLFVALQGLTLSAKTLDQKQINNFIEMTFHGI